MNKILLGLLLFPLQSHALDATKEDLFGDWNCKFTFPLVGDRILEESIKLKENNEFSTSGKFTYFLPKESKNAYFIFNSEGEWDYYNSKIKILYKPFDIDPMDRFSKEYISDIEAIYLRPSIRGTRRVEYIIEYISDEKMILGDEYDSWKCIRK